MIEKTELPRTKTPPIQRHTFFLRIPIDLRDRMIKDAGLTWGKMTPFILAAVREKLERMSKAN